MAGFTRDFGDRSPRRNLKVRMRETSIRSSATLVYSGPVRDLEELRVQHQSNGMHEKRFEIESCAIRESGKSTP